MPTQLDLLAALGRTFVRSQDEALITFTDLTITRRTLATRLGMATPIAARRFAAVCSQLGIKSTKDLLATAPIDLADVGRVGVTTLCVAIKVLEAAGHSSHAWYRTHHQTTWTTVLHHHRADHAKPAKRGRR